MSSSWSNTPFRFHLQHHSQQVELHGLQSRIRIGDRKFLPSIIGNSIRLHKQRLKLVFKKVQLSIDPLFHLEVLQRQRHWHRLLEKNRISNHPLYLYRDRNSQAWEVMFCNGKGHLRDILLDNCLYLHNRSAATQRTKKLVYVFQPW